jgi:hypothetical protein
MTQRTHFGARLTSGGGHKDTTMRMNELQKAYGLAVKASENPDTPLRERNMFRAVAHLIWESCGGTCPEIPRDPQSLLVAAADRIACR